MTDHLEIERKFDVSPEFVLPDLSVLASVAAPVTYHLAAVYYDTADLRLAAHRITLRRRAGGADEGWHMKLPAGEPGARREFGAPLRDQIPARFTAHIAGITAGAPVSPIATLDTERRVHTLLAPSGSLLAEVADDTVTARRTGDARPPLIWREIEVEAGPDLSPETARETLEAAARLLLAAAARPSGSGSKLARLLSR